MAVTRLHIPAELTSGAVVSVDEDRARYLVRVLRLRTGDGLRVFNGDQGEFEATLARIDRTSADIAVGNACESDAESSLKLQLVQGVSRGERMDFVVQKATELGVKRISPVLTEYGMVKLDAERAEKRRLHWEKVATSACEQSGRIRPPLIDLPIPLKQWFGERGGGDSSDVVLDPRADLPLVRLEMPTTKLCLLIGPEGGLSPIELEDAVVAGFTSVSMGPRILRTETAAVAALAIAQARWGDLGLD